MRPPRRALFTVSLLLVAAGSAAVVGDAHGGGAHVTTADFLAEVHAVCEDYGRKLDEIAPPTDLSLPGAVYELLGLALPVLKEQEEAVRALEAPEELRAELEKFYAITDESLVELKEAQEQAGARELFLMATALPRFAETRDDAKAAARPIGFDC